MTDSCTLLLAVVQQAPAEPHATPVEAIAMLLTLLAGLGVWAWLLGRRRRGIPLVAYEPRRRVPWGGGHALAILLGQWFALALTPRLIAGLLGIPVAAAGGAGQAATDHPVRQLLRDSPGLGTLLLCVVVVALVAPIVEEFVFRVVFQGWLEAEQRRSRRQRRGPRGCWRGAVPIALVSLVFALLHYRTAGPAVSSRLLLVSVIGSGVANLLVFGLAVWLLRRTTGATWQDLGLAPLRLGRDLRMGLVAFVAAAPLVYSAQTIALWLLPPSIAPDPVALFVFALALGFLYFRTHRAAPSVVVHMALNSTTLALLVMMG